MRRTQEKDESARPGDVARHGTAGHAAQLVNIAPATPEPDEPKPSTCNKQHAG